SASLEIELARRNVPFVKFGGLRFLDTAHVKDVLAFLRWAENPRDRVAGFRVVHLLPGAGPATAAKLLDRVIATAPPLQAIRARRPGRISPPPPSGRAAGPRAGRPSSPSCANGPCRISTASTRTR